MWTVESRDKANCVLAEHRAALGLQRSATQFAFITLVTGANFHTVFMVVAYLGYPCPGSSTYYEAQRTIVEILLELAEESCAREAALMGLAAAIGFDGRGVIRGKLHSVSAHSSTYFGTRSLIFGSVNWCAARVTLHRKRWSIGFSESLQRNGLI
jgi:hypothetical protein